MSELLFEYFYEYVNDGDIKILRIVANHSSIAYEKLRQTYPQGELKLIELRRLDY